MCVRRPAVFAKAITVFGSVPGNHRIDAAIARHSSMSLGVVTAIGVFAPIRTAAYPEIDVVIGDPARKLIAPPHAASPSHATFAPALSPIAGDRCPIRSSRGTHHANRPR